MRGWLAAFIVAWVLLSGVGLALATLEIRFSQALGGAALAATTVVIWLFVRGCSCTPRGGAWSAVVFTTQTRDGDERRNVLATARQLFLALCATTIGVTLVVFTLAAEGGREAVFSPVLSGSVVLTLGILAVAGERLAPPPLSCESPEALLVTYRARFFSRIAFAEAAALVGFAGFLLAQDPAVYLVGAVCAAVAFAHLAPTESGLARDQEQLTASGCGYQLAELLRGGGPGQQGVGHEGSE